MNEHQTGEFLLDLALLFALTYLLAGLLEQLRTVDNNSPKGISI